MSKIETIKAQLYQQCRQIIYQKIEELRQEMEQIQQAANLETKSSAGDKYETSRAMLQLEKDRLGGQLAEAVKLKKGLDELVVEKKYKTVQPGSLVATSRGNYFIAVSVGKLVVEGKTYFAISQGAPIGVALKGLKEGDEVIFQQHPLRVHLVE